MKFMTEEQKDTLYSEIKRLKSKAAFEFPFLRLKRKKEIVLTARVIPTKKPPFFGCFAVITPESRPNGIFFSLLETELEEDGLEVFHINFPATFSFNWEMDEHNVVGYRFQAKPDEAALKSFFKSECYYLKSKALLPHL